MNTAIIKTCWERLKQWQYLGIALIVLISLLLHLGLMMRPTEPLFDEVHYVNDARHALDSGATLRTEHPPLGKLLVIAGMYLFGDNPIGWRLIAIIMGTVSVLLFYLICRRLNLSEKVSYLATFFLAFENLFFVQSHIAMLDVYMVFFMLLAFWLYLRGNYPLSAVAVALSALAKLTGALAIAVIGLHWLLNRCPNWKRFIPSMLLAPAAFALLLPAFEYFYWGELFNPITRSMEMLKALGSITFDAYPVDGIASRPWEWVISPIGFTYWYTPRFVGMLSPTLWIMIIPSMAYMLQRCFKRDDAPLFPFAMFIALYIIWIPTSLISNRASFIFYFYPVIPSVALAMGIVFGMFIDASQRLERGKLRTVLKIFIPLYLLGHMVSFIIIGPTSLWWSIPFSLLVLIFSFFYLELGPAPYPDTSNEEEIEDQELPAIDQPATENNGI